MVTADHGGSGSVPEAAQGRCSSSSLIVNIVFEKKIAKKNRIRHCAPFLSILLKSVLYCPSKHGVFSYTQTKGGLCNVSEFWCVSRAFIGMTTEKKSAITVKKGQKRLISHSQPM